MQQSLQKPISEEPQNAPPLRGTSLLLWRLKHRFWGLDSITTAILAYGLTWIFQVYIIQRLLEALHLDLGTEVSFWFVCVSSFMYGVPSLVSAYLATQITPKWSAFAIGLFSGGFLGYYGRDLIRAIQAGDNTAYVSLVILLLANFCAFLLARKIRNKHFGIVKTKNP
jgi:hypothetical protein